MPLDGAYCNALLFVRWSVRQKLNHFSSAQFSTVTSLCTLSDACNAKCNVDVSSVASSQEKEKARKIVETFSFCQKTLVQNAQSSANNLCLKTI